MFTADNTAWREKKRSNFASESNMLDYAVRVVASAEILSNEAAIAASMCPMGTGWVIINLDVVLAWSQPSLVGRAQKFVPLGAR